MKKRKFKKANFSLFKLPKERKYSKRYNFVLHVNYKDTKYFQTKEQAEEVLKNINAETRKIESWKISRIS